MMLITVERQSIDQGLLTLIHQCDLIRICNASIIFLMVEALMKQFNETIQFNLNETICLLFAKQLYICSMVLVNMRPDVQLQ